MISETRTDLANCTVMCYVLLLLYTDTIVSYNLHGHCPLREKSIGLSFVEIIINEPNELSIF